MAENSYEVAQLLIVLHKSGDILCRQDLMHVAGEMQKLGGYLDRV